MDIQKYRLFVEIAELGSFTQAARKLGYTQSRASHAIKSLETQLGFRLFVRKKRAVFLTEPGRALLPAARVLLQGSEGIAQVVNEINGLRTGKLVIGSYSSISAMWLPPIIRAFSAEYPDVSIQLQEGDTAQIEQWVRDGAVDFAFLSYRAGQDFRWIPMLDDELMAVLPPEDPLAELAAVPVSVLQERQFIMPGGLGTDYNIRSTLDEEAFSPRTRLTVLDDCAIISMVRYGLGYSILPRLILEEHGAVAMARPLSPPLHRTLGIGLGWGYPLSPAAGKFIACALEMFRHEAYASAGKLDEELLLNDENNS